MVVFMMDNILLRFNLCMMLVGLIKKVSVYGNLYFVNCVCNVILEFFLGIVCDFGIFCIFN